MSAQIRIYDQDDDDAVMRAAAAQECARLRGQHALIQHAAGGKLVWAPLSWRDAGLNVLDSAGADGTRCRSLYEQISGDRWGEEEEVSWFVTCDNDAFKFPSADSAASNTGNLASFQFLEHDFTNPSWPAHLRGRFDLVHQRLALAASGKTPFSSTLQGFASLLKPGTGWLQLVELDISPQDGREDAMEDYMALLNAVSVVTGVRPHFAAPLKHDLAAAGFMEVSEELLRVPVGAAVKKDDFRSESIQNMVGFCARFVELAKKVQLPVDEDLPGRLELALRTRGSWLLFRIILGRKT